jgi:hypothetical protein
VLQDTKQVLRGVKESQRQTGESEEVPEKEGRGEVREAAQAYHS